MAAPLPLTLRIAMLNADTPVPKVREKRGSYGNIFHRLLVAAASRVSPNVTVEAVDFDVVGGQYPESPNHFDGLLITGSHNSSYDDNEWSRTLDAYLLRVYHDFPQVRIFGSCFGHQIVCQSLLRDHGVYVEKNPRGWELGVHKINLAPEYRKMLPAVGLAQKKDEIVLSSPSSSQRLQFIHSDHVKVPRPEALPDSWILMGNTPNCAVQGVYEPGRILTYQGHFEFDPFINMETVKVFGAKWDPDFLQEALDAMDNDDDSEAAADMVIKFFLEGRQAVQGDGGLMTPPL